MTGTRYWFYGHEIRSLQYSALLSLEREYLYVYSVMKKMNDFFINSIVSTISFIWIIIARVTRSKMDANWSESCLSFFDYAQIFCWFRMICLCAMIPESKIRYRGTRRTLVSRKRKCATSGKIRCQDNEEDWVIFTTLQDLMILTHSF